MDTGCHQDSGVSSNTAIFLLPATLVGSVFNIPIAELAPERAMSHHHVDFFGMRYAVPGVSRWKGTVVAVNVGGAVIPTLMSIYLLMKRELWVKGLVATAIVALVIHWMAGLSTSKRLFCRPRPHWTGRSTAR